MSNITGMLESLKLETMSQVYSSMAIAAEKNKKSYTDYLRDLAFIEIEERRNKTIAKFLRRAKLPRDKILQDFDITRIPSLSPSLLHFQLKECTLFLQIIPTVTSSFMVSD